MVASLKLLASLAIPGNAHDAPDFDVAKVRNDIFMTASHEEMRAIGPRGRGQVWASAHERLLRDLKAPVRHPVASSSSACAHFVSLQHLTGIGEDLRAYGVGLERQQPEPTSKQIDTFKKARALVQGQVDYHQVHYQIAQEVFDRIGSN